MPTSNTLEEWKHPLTKTPIDFSNLSPIHAISLNIHAVRTPTENNLSHTDPNILKLRNMILLVNIPRQLMNINHKVTQPSMKINPPIMKMSNINSNH